MILGSDGITQAVDKVTLPVVSTDSAKNATRAAADVSGLADALMATLNLIDQVQTAGQDPSRMRVNRGTKKSKNKKWNGG